MYVITAWNGSEHVVRCPNAKEALLHAKDLISKGNKVSIARSSNGESVTVRELEQEIASTQSS